MIKYILNNRDNTEDITISFDDKRSELENRWIYDTLEFLDFKEKTNFLVDIRHHNALYEEVMNILSMDYQTIINDIKKIEYSFFKTNDKTKLIKEVYIYFKNECSDLFNNDMFAVVVNSIVNKKNSMSSMNYWDNTSTPYRDAVKELENKPLSEETIKKYNDIIVGFNFRFDGIQKIKGLLEFLDENIDKNFSEMDYRRFASFFQLERIPDTSFENNLFDDVFENGEFENELEYFFVLLKSFEGCTGVCECRNLIEFINAAIIDILKNHYLIKKCKNCGKFFVAYNRSDTLYCDRKAPQDEKKTCKEYGAYKQYQDNLKNNASAKLYRNIYMQRQMLLMTVSLILFIGVALSGIAMSLPYMFMGSIWLLVCAFSAFFWIIASRGMTSFGRETMEFGQFHKMAGRAYLGVAICLILTEMAFFGWYSQDTVIGLVFTIAFAVAGCICFVLTLYFNHLDNKVRRQARNS